MSTNVDNRGQGAREHYTAQTSFISAALNATNFAANGFVQIGTVPAGARILAAYTIVDVAFNSQTNNGLSIGLTTGGSEIAAGTTTNLSNLGNQPVTIKANANGPYITSGPQPVYAVANMSGTAATTGIADVVVVYATVHGASDNF